LDKISRQIQPEIKVSTRAFTWLAGIVRAVTVNVIDMEVEDTMLRHLSIWAALIAVATGSVNAQQQEAVLQKLTVPGATFDIILAVPKPSGATYDLGKSPEALLVHLVGGELALGFDGEATMLKALESLRMPVCAFHVESKDKPRKPVSVYIVPKSE
jgi:hypothetical protein